MSLSADLELHELFSFNEATKNSAADLPLSGDSFAAPRLASPFPWPLEDLQGQAVGWLSPSAPDPVDGLDAVNFDEFLALDESTDGVSAAAQKAPAASPPGLAVSSTPQDDLAAAPEPAEDLPAIAQMDSVRDEIAQLKAVLAEGLQTEVSTRSDGRQSGSRPCKRKLDGGEVSPPKRQMTTEIGPIEAFWSPKVTEFLLGADHTSLAPPATPKPSSPQLDFTAQPSTPPTDSPVDQAMSPEDLLSIQQFLSDNPATIHGTSQQVEISSPPSDITMGHLVNTKAKRVPPQQAPRRASRPTTSTTNKITKKTKTTPKKTKHQRTSSKTSNIAPSRAALESHRSIEELLAANFYSLNAQEKVRIMLPMLRNLDPRELETNLAALPSIQAKGAGHEVRVAQAIHDSPPTPEDDDILATKLTFGTPLSPTPAAKRNFTSPQAPQTQMSPLSHNTTRGEVSENHGAVRQREALEKAAALQTQAKNR